MADTLMNLTSLQSTLEDMARDIAEGYKDELERNDHFTKLRTLINSIRTQVNVGDTYYEVTMTLEHYWKYLEQGVQGDRNPTSPYLNPGWKAYPHIARWIEIKPVIPRPMDGRKAPSPKSLAYLITRSIVQHGTRGTHDLEKTKDAVITAYRDKLEAALQHDLYNYILKVTKT